MLSPNRDSLIKRESVLQIHGLAEQAQAGHIYLVTGSGKLVGSMSQVLVDRLAARGAVYVIVGGNRYSLEYLPLLLSQQPQLLEEALQRIQITRAETCYQLLDALQHTQPHQSPLVVTDLLATLSEEDIEDVEAQRLLGEYLRHLKKLSAREAVLVSAAQSADRPHLLERLRGQVSDEVRLLEPTPESAHQQIALLPED